MYHLEIIEQPSGYWVVILVDPKKEVIMRACPTPDIHQAHGRAKRWADGLTIPLFLSERVETLLLSEAS